MQETSSVLSILPNLGIGVVCVLALVYTTKTFLGKLEIRAAAHEKAMSERENALRNVERDMRATLASIVAQANTSIAENTRVLHRVINHLDRSNPTH